MADQNNVPQPNVQKLQQQRVYRGRPEYQVDPQAVNKFQPPPQRQIKVKPKFPKAMPKPTQVRDDAELQRSKVVERSPLLDSVFSEDITVREVNLQTRQQPSMSASVELSRLTYNQMLIDDPNLSKSWTPEAFEYYCTALLWMRIVSLKILKTLHVLKKVYYKFLQH